MHLIRVCADNAEMHDIMQRKPASQTQTLELE